jgi:hypothetical protein
MLRLCLKREESEGLVFLEGGFAGCGVGLYFGFFSGCGSSAEEYSGGSV